MLKTAFTAFAVAVLTASTALQATAPAAAGESARVEQLQRDLVDLRYGMFICYNIMSYGAGWGQANYPIDSFNPQQLDCNQWAEAAASAGMKFGLLTTKHHEGFCLWDSEYTEYDVAATPYKKDIVQQYVDAFRKEGLRVGLYYSIWDSTHGVEKGQITPEKIEFAKGQITELLTNYGEIDYFVIDGWWWRMGHNEVPYDEIRNLIRELQPNCLITDHTHLQSVYHLDIPYFEGPYGAYPSEDNAMPSALGECVFPGNGWFWSEKTAATPVNEGRINQVVKKLTECEQRYCLFMLNCMPNRDGLLDSNALELLTEVGKRWQADETRKPLPSQGAQLIFPVAAESATATSGDASLAIDLKQYGAKWKHWVADEGYPQSITLDLGANYSDLEMLVVLPNCISKPGPERSLTEGNVTAYELSLSSDNETYTKVAEGRWEADAKIKKVFFPKTTARYLQFTILDANGKEAIIAQIEAGAFANSPKKVFNKK